MKRPLTLGIALVLGSCQHTQGDTSKPSITAPTIESGLITTDESSIAIQLIMKRGGVPVFRKVDDHFELLSKCRYPGEFTYESTSPVTREEANISGGRFVVQAYRAASAGIERQKTYSMRSKSAGSYVASNPKPTKGLLLDCPEATHVASHVYVGAFAVEQQTQLNGGVGVGVRQVGMEGGGQSSTRVAVAVGSFSRCVHRESSPPTDCDAPIRVDLVPLEDTYTFEYYFDTQTVVGALSREASFTVDDLHDLKRDLNEALTERGRARGIEVRELPRPDAQKTVCGVSADSTSDRYLVQCNAGEYRVAEAGEERKALPSQIPEVARQLLPDRHEAVEALAPVGRLVVLIDNSKSMLVNDHDTFFSDDIKQSARYKSVRALLEGLMLNGVHPNVALVAFAGTGCAASTSIDSANLWPLTRESGDQALDWLEAALEVPPCTGGTDLTGALHTANDILSSAPKNDSGHDAVVLITDGFHQAPNTGPPRDQAEALVDAGAHLHIVRVQLNDLGSLREYLSNAKRRKQVLRKWFTFAGEKYDDLWEDEIEEINIQNDEGKLLLSNLEHVNVGTFILSSDDITSNPLLNVHHYLLPRLGVTGRVEGINCERPEDFTQDDGTRVWQMACDLYVPLGRELTVTANIPACMHELVRARIQTRDDGATDLTTMTRVGASVTFAKLKVGRPTAGQVKIDKVALTIRSKIDEGVPCE